VNRSGGEFALGVRPRPCRSRSGGLRPRLPFQGVWKAYEVSTDEGETHTETPRDEASSFLRVTATTATFVGTGGKLVKKLQTRDGEDVLVLRLEKGPAVTVMDSDGDDLAQVFREDEKKTFRALFYVVR
jgi:hypothetical protein